MGIGEAREPALDVRILLAMIENVPSGDRSWIMSRLPLRISIRRLSVEMLLR